MQLEYVLLADAVENVNGKLYVMGGGWTQFKASSFPALCRVGIAASVLVDWEETEDGRSHGVKLVISDRADEKSFEMGLEGQIQAGRPDTVAPGAVQRVFVTVNLNVPIPRPGKYQIGASLSAKQKTEVEFEAILVPSP
jgi:uncharacterized protein DUF6941